MSYYQTLVRNLLAEKPLNKIKREIVKIIERDVSKKEILHGVYLWLSEFHDNKYDSHVEDVLLILSPVLWGVDLYGDDKKQIALYASYINEDEIDKKLYWTTSLHMAKWQSSQMPEGKVAKLIISTSSCFGMIGSHCDRDHKVLVHPFYNTDWERLDVDLTNVPNNLNDYLDSLRYADIDLTGMGAVKGSDIIELMKIISPKQSDTYIWGIVGYRSGVLCTSLENKDVWNKTKWDREIFFDNDSALSILNSMSEHDKVDCIPDKRPYSKTIVFSLNGVTYRGEISIEEVCTETFHIVDYIKCSFRPQIISNPSLESLLSK